MAGQRGFTLAELLMATVLLTLLAAGGMAAFSAGTRAAAKMKRCDSMVAHAQAALESMTNDLHAATQRANNYCMMALDTQREGRDTDTIDFLVAGPPKSDFEDSVPAGYCEVGYSIGESPETGQPCLMRREDSTPDDDLLEGGTSLPVAPGVSELNIEFYDGIEWVSGWSTPKQFPKAVRIQIAVVDEDGSETPRKFSTTVALMQEWQ